MVADLKGKSEKQSVTVQDIFKNVTYYIVGDVSEEVYAL